MRDFLKNVFLLAIIAASLGAVADAQSEKKTVKGKMQARPGGPLEEVEVEVHEGGQPLYPYYFGLE